jgi:AraC family ethanolamine operon transcriptional activator
LDRWRAFAVYRTARGYVEDRLADDAPTTIVDICREIRVSERTLQYAFYAYISPHAYLRICRLNRARAGLTQPSTAKTTVTEVAIGHGFFHLGKFARDYRLHFGEAPSTTLAEALRRAA